MWTLASRAPAGFARWARLNRKPGDSRLTVMLVVIGPGTRLAREVLQQPGLNFHRTLLVASDRGEADWLAGFYPGRPIYRSWDEKAELPEAREGVGVVVCSALSGNSTRPGASCALLRNLWLVAKVLRSYEQVPVHVSCASHVQALVARPELGVERAAEAALAELTVEFPMTSLSVVFAGGLVERRTASRPSTFTRTTYAAFAGTLLELSRGVRGEGRVLGVDARLRLLRMGVEHGLFAVLGRVSMLRINQRMRLDSPATVGHSGITRALQSAPSVSYDAFAAAAGDAHPADLQDSNGVHQPDMWKSGR